MENEINPRRRKKIANRSKKKPPKDCLLLWCQKQQWRGTLPVHIGIPARPEVAAAKLTGPQKGRWRGYGRILDVDVGYVNAMVRWRKIPQTQREIFPSDHMLIRRPGCLYIEEDGGRGSRRGNEFLRAIAPTPWRLRPFSHKHPRLLLGEAGGR